MAFRFQSDRATRGPDKKDRDSEASRKGPFKKDKRFTFSLWYVALGLLILTVYHSLSQIPAPEEIPYSEFKMLVNSGEVTEVVISGDRIRGTFQEKKHPVCLGRFRKQNGRLEKRLEPVGEPKRLHASPIGEWVDGLA